MQAQDGRGWMLYAMRLDTRNSAGVARNRHCLVMRGVIGYVIQNNSTVSNSLARDYRNGCKWWGLS